jgi:hypothetical protein
LQRERPCILLYLSPRRRVLRRKWVVVHAGAMLTALGASPGKGTRTGRQLPQAKPGWWLKGVCVCATEPSRHPGAGASLLCRHVRMRLALQQRDYEQWTKAVLEWYRNSNGIDDVRRQMEPATLCPHTPCWWWGQTLRCWLTRAGKLLSNNGCEDRDAGVCSGCSSGGRGCRLSVVGCGCSASMYVPSSARWPSSTQQQQQQ